MRSPKQDIHQRHNSHSRTSAEQQAILEKNPVEVIPYDSERDGFVISQRKSLKNVIVDSSAAYSRVLLALTRNCGLARESAEVR